MKMINYDNLVSVDKVAREAKKCLEFIMFKCQSGNLLMTNHFAINLTSEQFWKVQCKLEIPERGVWYLKGKNIPERSEREANLYQLEQKYNEWLTSGISQLENTRLTLCEQYAIYADEIGYVALDNSKLDMFSSLTNLIKAGSMVIIDGLHIISVAHQRVFEETEYLKGLSEGVVNDENNISNEQ